MRILVFIFGLFLIVEGCFSTSSTSSTSNTQAAQPVRLSAQEKAEQSVSSYIRKTDPSGSNYKSYNFGKLFRLPAPEIQQLESYQKTRSMFPAVNPADGSTVDSSIRHYDTLIAQQERLIKRDSIRSRLIISHLYTVKHSEKEGGRVMEADFILDADFNVVDYRSKLATELNGDDFEWFFYFFRQAVLVSSGDQSVDRVESDQIYDMYNTRLYEMTADKDAFLVTALRVTRAVYRYKTFDKSRVAAYVMMKYLQEQDWYPNYHALKFSPAEEIMAQAPGGDSLIGYRQFHLFEMTDSLGAKVQNGVYAEFDVFFHPAGFMRLDPPYDKYFGE